MLAKNGQGGQTAHAVQGAVVGAAGGDLAGDVLKGGIAAKIESGEEQIEDKAVHQRHDPADEEVADLQRMLEGQELIMALHGKQQGIALHRHAPDVFVAGKKPRYLRPLKGNSITEIAGEADAVDTHRSRQLPRIDTQLPRYFVVELDVLFRPDMGCIIHIPQKFELVKFEMGRGVELHAVVMIHLRIDRHADEAGEHQDVGRLLQNEKATQGGADKGYLPGRGSHA